MEKICTLLNCTPNDLMEWTPGSSNLKTTDHPLNELIRDKKTTDYMGLLRGLPLNKLEDIAKIIKSS